jgi:importin-5
MLLSCGKNSGTLTVPMVSVTFQQLITCISTETDSSFLASLYKCFTDSLMVIGGPASLAPDFVLGIMEATKRQLQALADKRKGRAARSANGGRGGRDVNGDGDIDADDEDLALLEEMEDFALEDMAKMLTCFDKDHPLLVAVASVRDLAIARLDSDDEGDSEG